MAAILARIDAEEPIIPESFGLGESVDLKKQREAAY